MSTGEAQEKTPVYGYLQQPSMVDFEGHLSMVIFTSGCNFECGFCHNAPLMAEPKLGLTWDKLKHACKQFRLQWVDGVVISGGEPTIWGDKLLELIEFFNRQQLDIKLDTNGSNPELLQEAIPLVDYVSMDVKCSPQNYPRLAGFDSEDKIQKSIRTIIDSEIRHEFRTTVIEDFHTDSEMIEICRLIEGAQYYILQPFLPRDNLPDPALRSKPRTSPERLEQIKQQMNNCAQHVITRGG